jgi:hypothetical protein
MNDTCCECGIRVGDFACVMCIEALETKLVEARLSHFVMGLAWAGFYASCNLAFVDTAAERDEWKRRAEHKSADELGTLKRGMDALGQCITERDEAIARADQAEAEVARLVDQRSRWMTKLESTEDRVKALEMALRTSEAALADIGDSEGPDRHGHAASRSWMEQRARKALPVARAALAPIAAPGASEAVALTPEQFEHVVDMIENPRPPTQALVDLLRKEKP